MPTGRARLIDVRPEIEYRAAHIPTGTATNNEFDIDEMNSRRLNPVVASAIGADIETGRVAP